MKLFENGSYKPIFSISNSNDFEIQMENVQFYNNIVSGTLIDIKNYSRINLNFVDFQNILVKFQALNITEVLILNVFNTNCQVNSEHSHYNVFQIGGCFKTTNILNRNFINVM